MANIKIKTGGKSTLVGTFIPVGSRNEPDEIKGISHLLEHMLFKGTEKRDKNEIKKSLDKYGAEFNAWTSEEHTMYYATISSKYATEAREVISDMVNNSILPEDELEKEKQVVLQELEMYEDNPKSHVFELAQREVFKTGSGLHIPIIGTRETIESIDRNTLLKYYKDNYKVNFQVDIGNIPRAEDNRIYLNAGFCRENKEYTADNLIVRRSGLNQANMVVTGSFHIESVEESYTLQLLGAIMNGFSGRFFDVIREKYNLVYHTGFYFQQHSCGTVQYWGYAGLKPEKVDLANTLIKEQLVTPVTAEELDFARTKWLGQYELDMDEKRTLAKLVIDSTMSGEDYQDHMKKYKYYMDKITVNDINSLVTKINFENSKLVAIVPDK